MNPMAVGAIMWGLDMKPPISGDRVFYACVTFLKKNGLSWQALAAPRLPTCSDGMWINCYAYEEGFGEKVRAPATKATDAPRL